MISDTPLDAIFAKNLSCQTDCPVQRQGEKEKLKPGENIPADRSAMQSCGWSERQGRISFPRLDMTHLSLSPTSASCINGSRCNVRLSDERITLCPCMAETAQLSASRASVLYMTDVYLSSTHRQSRCRARLDDRICCLLGPPGSPQSHSKRKF